MSASNNGFELPAKHKRPMVSCRECHRRKEKCDRRHPCIRCIRRGKRNACVYELEQTRMNHLHTDSVQHKTNSNMQDQTETPFAASHDDDNESSLLGYADTNDTKCTPGIIRALGESTDICHGSHPRKDAAASRYISAIRQLPSPRHIDLLVRFFFQNVAWHYDMVDEASFTAQLSKWSSLSHGQLTKAPEGLPTSLQAFPALLLQVLAQALLFQPKRYDKTLNDLKYTANMELSDRAAEYSDAGHGIASSFPKSRLNLTIVQAELMRACFEKTTGAVREAWHTLGTAIRDAQELGLHNLGQAQSLDWLNETNHRDQGRKVWLILHLWDTHMGIVLGRPISTRMNPDDVPSPTPWDCGSDSPRQPKPRDVILCGYHIAYKYLQDIHDLEKLDDCSLVVDNIHSNLLANISNLPKWAQVQRSGDCQPAWLYAALEMMHTNIYFVLFALHRPFIFGSPTSRAAAMYAATEILESQARLFDQTESLQHKAFAFVFGTFDAMVLIIAILIQFPEEFTEQLPTMQVKLDEALERLRLLRASNELAGSAFQIVQRLYEKMMTAITPSTQTSSMDSRISDGTAGLETGTDWINALPPDLESYLIPPEPFNELLCNGSFGIDPTSHTGLIQPHFGVTDSLGEGSY